MVMVVYWFPCSLDFMVVDAVCYYGIKYVGIAFKLFKLLAHIVKLLLIYYLTTSIFSVLNCKNFSPSKITPRWRWLGASCHWHMVINTPWERESCRIIRLTSFFLFCSSATLIRQRTKNNISELTLSINLCRLQKEDWFTNILPFMFHCDFPINFDSYFRKMKELIDGFN